MAGLVGGWLDQLELRLSQLSTKLKLKLKLNLSLAKLQFFMLQETVRTGNMSIERTFKRSLGLLLVFSRLFMKYISLFKVQNYCSEYPFSLRTHHFSMSNVASKTWISP